MTREIRESIVVAATPDHVFRCLTEPRELMQWWTTPDYPALHWEIALERGGKWLSRWRGPGGEEFALGGEIVELDPPTVLEYTWWDERYPSRPHTRVRYDIEPIDGGCRVRVRHYGFDGTRDDFSDYNGGWSSATAKLRAHAEHGVIFHANRDVAIEVSNLTTARAFYVDGLGLRLCSESETHVEVDAGALRLWIKIAPRAKTFMPSFDVADAALARTAVERAGGRVISGHDSPDGFVFEDPFGLAVDVIRRGLYRDESVHQPNEPIGVRHRLRGKLHRESVDLTNAGNGLEDLRRRHVGQSQSHANGGRQSHRLRRRRPDSCQGAAGRHGEPLTHDLGMDESRRLRRLGVLRRYDFSAGCLSDLLHRQRIAGGKDHRNAERAGIRGIELAFADFNVVQPQSLHTARAGVRDESVRRSSARVISEEDHRVERRVQSGDHTNRLHCALDVDHARIELGVQEVLHVAVRVVDEHLRRPALENRGDDGVHLVSHETPAERVVFSRRTRHCRSANPADALHVDRDEDLGLALAMSARRRRQQRAEQQGGVPNDRHDVGAAAYDSR